MRFQLFIFSFLMAGVTLALSPIEKAQWKAINGEYIVKFNNNLSTNNKMLNEYGLKKKNAIHEKSNLHLINIHSLKQVKRKLPIATESSAMGISAELIKALEALPNIDYVEPNYIYDLIDAVDVKEPATQVNIPNNQSGVTPNDEFFYKLWGMTYIQAPNTWYDAIGGDFRDITVAIFDTGITAEHPDLKGNLWQAQTEEGKVIHGYNTFDYTLDPIDEHGHGTHVAGTIGATGNNEIGVVGVNWKVKMLSVKIFGGKNASFIGVAGVVQALDWTTLIGVNLSSHSWGGGAFSQALYDSISRANDAGIPFVAAAGNSYSNNDESLAFPASYDLDNIISVAAVDQEGKKPGFSNWGINTVDIAAPGVDIFSTHIDNGYTQMSGTSMATPHVSGALALLMAQDWWMDGQEAKELLLQSTMANKHLEEYIGDEGATLNIYNMVNGIYR